MWLNLRTYTRMVEQNPSKILPNSHQYDEESWIVVDWPHTPRGMETEDRTGKAKIGKNNSWVEIESSNKWMEKNKEQVIKKQSFTTSRLMASQSLSNGYGKTPSLVLLLSRMSDDTEHHFGQFRWAVLPESPPKLVPYISLLAGWQSEKQRRSWRCENIVQQ